MRTAILTALTGALALAGCGATTEDRGIKLMQCQTPQLSEMALKQPLDGIEIRVICDPIGAGSNQTPAAASATYGMSCSADTCHAEALASDEQELGWSQSVQITCRYHVIGMKDGHVVVNAGNDAELLDIFGPIDTLAEAQAVANLKHLECVRAGTDAGDQLIVGEDMIESCPIKRQEVLYRIDADTSVHELNRGKITEEGSCVGRRPSGLSPRRTAPSEHGVGEYLARAAELEAASVVAFQVLEAELRAHGAPAELLERTQQAARDEILHAQLMQRLAGRFGGEVSPRSVRVGQVRDLETIASENAVEGCVVETWGCLLGMHQALHARAELRGTYGRIARDEARHAQLAWDIADWAEQQLDAKATARVDARRAKAVANLSERLAEDVESHDVQQALGLPPAATRLRLFTELRATLWS